MKRKILTLLAWGIFNSMSAQVIYTENFDNDVDPSGYYTWSWYNQSNTTISNNVKASASELQISLANAGGSGQDNNALYFTLYDNSGSIDLNMVSQKKVYVTMKSDVDVTVRLDMRDNADLATDKNPVTQDLLGDGNYHTLIFDFDNKFINWQDVKVDSTVMHSLVFNFNRDVSPAVSGTITFDKVEIGSTTTSVQENNSLVNILKIYPNPASDRVQIELDLATESKVRIALCDIVGKEVLLVADKSMSAMSKSFSTAGLNSGTYYLNYKINDGFSKSEVLIIK